MCLLFSRPLISATLDPCGCCILELFCGIFFLFNVIIITILDGLIFVVAVHGSIITACGWNPLLSLMIRFWLFHKNYLCLFLFTCGSDLNPLMMYASGFGCFFYMFFIIFGM